MPAGTTEYIPAGDSQAAVPFPTKSEGISTFSERRLQVFPVCCFSLAVTAGKRAFRRRMLRRPHPARREVTCGDTDMDWPRLGAVLHTTGLWGRSYLGVGRRAASRTWQRALSKRRHGFTMRLTLPWKNTHMGLPKGESGWPEHKALFAYRKRLEVRDPFDGSERGQERCLSQQEFQLDWVQQLKGAPLKSSQDNREVPRLCLPFWRSSSLSDVWLLKSATSSPRATHMSFPGMWTARSDLNCVWLQRTRWRASCDMRCDRIPPNRLMYETAAVLSVWTSTCLPNSSGRNCRKACP